MEIQLFGGGNGGGGVLDYGKSLLDLCEGSERAPVARLGIQWWEQVGIDLVGVQESVPAAVEGGGG